MSIRILLIEDNPDHILFTKRILEKADEDYQLDSVSQAQEGLRRIIEENYDLILCDYRMPGLSALDILKEMRNRNKDLPFIVVTATGSEKAAVDLMKEGAYDYMLKDVLYEEALPVVIKKAIERYNTKKERERAEEALRESEERYRTLVQNVPIGVYRTVPGAKGKFLIANPTYLKMFGLDSEEELKKISVADTYMNPNDRKGFSDNLLAKGSVEGIELPLRKKDGTIFWGSVTARVMYDENGKNPYFDCTIMDITDRKRAEDELKKRMHELETFQKVAVGRELKMVELKKRIKELETRLQEDERILNR
jgi:PAS domain S-box-containing protein